MKVKTVKLDNTLIKSGKKVTFSYFRMASLCLSTAPAEGLDTQKVRDRIEVLAVFEKSTDATKSIDISAKQLNELIACFKQMKWNTVNSIIPQFEDYILGLKEEF